MVDDMQEKIKKLLEVDPREYFTVNNSKFECYFWNRDPNVKPFSEWKKDENSPSFFCEAKVRVYANDNKGSYFDGLVVVQKDSRSTIPLSAFLYVKKYGEEKWQSMHNIVDIVV